MNTWLSPWLVGIHLIFFQYWRPHNVRVCLYISYIACGSALLYIKTLYFFFCTLTLSAVATVTNIKIHYDAKTLQDAIFGTRIICVFYSIHAMYKYSLSNEKACIYYNMRLDSKAPAETQTLLCHPPAQVREKNLNLELKWHLRFARVSVNVHIN